MNKKALLIVILVMLSGCGLLSRQVVYIPTPVPCAKAEIPPTPDYPLLAKGATPKQVMEFFVLKITLQEGYIGQLTTILKGYK